MWPRAPWEGVTVEAETTDRGVCVREYKLIRSHVPPCPHDPHTVCEHTIVNIHGVVTKQSLNIAHSTVFLALLRSMRGTRRARRLAAVCAGLPRFRFCICCSPRCCCCSRPLATFGMPAADGADSNRRGRSACTSDPRRRRGTPRTYSCAFQRQRGPTSTAFAPRDANEEGAAQACAGSASRALDCAPA